MDFKPRMQIDRYKIHDIEVVVDIGLRLPMIWRGEVKPECSKKLYSWEKRPDVPLINDDKVVQYSKQLMCEDTGISYEEPSPNASFFFLIHPMAHAQPARPGK